VFERIVCLNLDQRYDERQRIDREFAGHGLKVDYFLAGSGKLRPKTEYQHIDFVMGPPGYLWEQQGRMPSYNALLSFLKIIIRARDEGVKSLLICEDDVTLTPEFGQVAQAAWDDVHRIDPKWQMLYLGANHTWGRTQEVTPHLLRLLGGSQCWHCVGLHERAYTQVLGLPHSAPIDDLCARIMQKEGHCYAAWPSVALQRPGYSYCDKKYQDYLRYFSAKGC
jgi:hypothetical protein